MHVQHVKPGKLDERINEFLEFYVGGVEELGQ
jgi:hypothetical protein